jgi:hypothetical protein
MSESIGDGYFPWWNPYVNFGLPQHADMSSGFWNPATWLISLTTGYNIYSITLELLFYIFIAGIGMYKVTGLWQLNKYVRIIAAVSYMCSGYMIGHIQHINWISGAAFLPWCFFSYMLMVRGFSFYRIAITVCCFYLLISSSHPGLIIGSFYFFLIFFVYYLICSIRNVSTGNSATGVQLLTLLTFFALLMVITTGMILSYSEILPFITRGNRPVIVNQTAANSIRSLLSFLLPFSSIKNENTLHNPLSFKNFYIGIAPLLFLLSSFILIKKYRDGYILLFTGIFFLLISVTGPVQAAVYKFIPLFNYVRASREFRIFAIFSFIAVAAIAMNHFLASAERKSAIEKLIWFLLFVTGLLICWSILKIFITHQSLLFVHLSSVGSENYREYLKQISSSLSFYDTILIQGIFQIVILILIKKYLFLKNTVALLIICAMDIIAASSLNLPFTGYGKTSAKELQKQLNQSPKGIPTPALQPISLNDTGNETITKTIGSWNHYNKQPGTLVRTYYPIQFRNEERLFSKPVINHLSSKSFIFFTPSEYKLITSKDSLSQLTNAQGSAIKILHFIPSYIKVNLKASVPGRITLLYQNYPHWKVFVNGKEIIKKSASDDFINTDIQSGGSYIIEYSYRPSVIKKCFLIGASILFVLILFISIKSTQFYFQKKKESYT